jgi:hypothetical protein
MVVLRMNDTQICTLTKTHKIAMFLHVDFLEWSCPKLHLCVKTRHFYLHLQIISLKLRELRMHFSHKGMLPT